MQNAFYCAWPTCERHPCMTTSSKGVTGETIERFYVRNQILRVMKLTAAILFTMSLHVSANVLSQSITYSGVNVPLEKVIPVIEKQTGLFVFYEEKLLENARPVTIHADDMPLVAFLNKILDGQKLEFTIKGKTVFISQKFTADLSPADIGAELTPPIDVRGRIVDPKGDPVAGASVIIKNTNKGTQTDGNGAFQLKGVDAEATLLISATNIETFEIKINGRSELLLRAKLKSSLLDEMQVIAYGSVSRRFNLGAVSTVKSEDIQKQPVNNVLLALQGRVPGIMVTPTSGSPGALAKIQVRGQNTLLSNLGTFSPYDQPLIIIDGSPFAPQNLNVNLLESLGAGYGFNTYQGLGAMSNINPADIESVSILRDADATSIYGSQGANGVIIITTKKGKPGKTSLGMSVNTGPNKITRTFKFLNTQQYVQMRYEALANDGIELPPAFDGQYPDLQLFDTTKFTDWADRFFGGTSNNTDVYANLTGGTEYTNFILSAGYNRTTYNFPGNFAEQRLSLHSGFQYRNKSNKFSLNFGTDFSYNRNNTAAQPGIGSTLALLPHYPEMLDENGNLIWEYKGVQIEQYYAALRRPYLAHKYNLHNNLQLTYKVFTGLSAMVNLGYSRFNVNERSQSPLSTQSPFDPFKSGYAQFSRNDFETINIEPQLNYQQNIGRGVFSVLAGATYKSNTTVSEKLDAYGYSNDGFLGSVSAATSIAATGNTLIYKYVAAYGRLGYIYDNKYILNITGRRDGSTNFGPGKQYGNFGSFGAGWILSEERGVKTLLPFASMIKLAVNYGTNGSDGIAPYRYQDFWQISQDPRPFQGHRPYVAMNLYNPDYSWAEKRSWNVMLDLGLFNDRLLINTIWYHNRTDNQLVDRLLPSQTGFTSVTDNLDATVQNTGWEFTVNSTNIKSGDFLWTTNFNLSINRNKLVAFPDIERSAYSYYYKVGASTSAVLGYFFKGVNEQTGIFEFYDGKGNPTYEPAYALREQGGDRGVIADLQPKFTGGFENTFSYKGWSLSAMFQFSKQQNYSYLYWMYSGISSIGGLTNLPVQALNHWRKPGDKTPLQKAAATVISPAMTAASYFSMSSGAYKDATYLRLKNLALSYSFPETFIRKAGMENLRLYVNVQNLLTFTNVEVGDPELPGDLFNFPMQRNVAFGLSFTF